MNTATSSSAARSSRPECIPNSGSSVRSADSTSPATNAASITMGAVLSAPDHPRSGVKSWAALVTRRSTPMGNRVRIRQAAPITKGLAPGFR